MFMGAVRRSDWGDCQLRLLARILTSKLAVRGFGTLRLSTVISALILSAAGALSAYGWTLRPNDAGAITPASGMDILRDHKCRRGETKSIIVRGVEDNHSPAGEEPIFIREGRMNPLVQSFANGSYDQVQPDRRLTDSFGSPTNTASGLFLMRLKPVADNQNDTFRLGDLTTMGMSRSKWGQFGHSIATLGAAPGWSRQGEYYFAELAGIQLMRLAKNGSVVRTQTLLDFIRAGGSEGWVDYDVQDDTSVDFMGIALCREPPRGNGLTLAPTWVAPQMPDVVALTCFYGGQDEQMCDPYVGDTSCSAQLPLVCLRPDSDPLPKALKDQPGVGTWSGSELAFTEPVAGSRFATSGDADALCEARFGKEWRMARWHDGPGNAGIAGRSSASGPSSRVWIDIVGSPYATCWAR
jgi:hypothetical protein